MKRCFCNFYNLIFLASCLPEDVIDWYAVFAYLVTITNWVWPAQSSVFGQSNFSLFYFHFSSSHFSHFHSLIFFFLTIFCPFAVAYWFFSLPEPWPPPDSSVSFPFFPPQISPSAIELLFQRFFLSHPPLSKTHLHRLSPISVLFDLSDSLVATQFPPKLGPLLSSGRLDA